MNPLCRAFLIDLDGVIYVQQRLIPGAVEVLQTIRERNIPHRFVTNTSSYSRRQLLKKLAAAGIEIPVEHLFTAPLAAAAYLRTIPDCRCFFYANPNVLEDMEDITLTEEDPTHVVIGDVGDGFNHKMMTRVFRMIMRGAEIVALQKNRYWLTQDGITLDAGAYIAALEYATGKSAIVIGKPSQQFFLQACAGLGLPPGEVTMIGDDLKADIRGAADAGLHTIFVKTGKDKDTALEDHEARPDIVFHSLAELSGLL